MRGRCDECFLGPHWPHAASHSKLATLLLFSLVPPLASAREIK